LRWADPKSFEVEMIKVMGRFIKWQAGMTVAEVVRRVGYDFPYYFVTVNGTVVKPAELRVFVVPEGAEVQFHPIVVGG
jgi:sulfur carrier protein ThiS